MTGQFESTLVLAVRDRIKWESALDAPSQGTLTPLDPSLAIDPLVYQERDRQLADRDLIVGAAVVDTSIQISNVYNYPAVKPKLQGPVTKDLPFVAAEITSSGTASQVRHVKNSSVPYDASRYADSDLYGRDALVYEVLARACEQAFVDPPISRIDSAGTIFPDLTAWSLAEGNANPADINPALALNRDLFKVPDQNLADRDTVLATYVANLAQVLKNPFTKALRIYVKVEGPNNEEREPDIYVLISDDGVNRVWRGEPALTNRNRIVYNIANKTLQWIRESVDEVHVPQIYAMTIPGIDAGQLLSTLAQVPETKDAQYWRQKAGRIVPDGEQLSSTGLYLHWTSSDAASGGITQVDAASLTAPGQISVTVSSGSLDAGKYRVNLLTEPSPRVEIAGAQNLSSTSGTLGGATFDIDVPSGSITTKQYVVVGGDGILYNGAVYESGDIFYGLNGTTAYTQAGASASAVRQYAVYFQLSLTPGPWNATIEYTNLNSNGDGFGIKAQYIANGANAANIIQDTVLQPFTQPSGVLVQTESAGFDVDDSGAFSFPVFWTYGSGQLHIRKVIFESNVTQGHFQVRGQFGAGSLAYVDVIGTAFQPDVMRFDFNTSGSITPVTFTADWVSGNDMPLKIKQIDIQSIGTYNPTPVSAEYSGWRQECIDRAERTIQQSYATALRAYGTSVPTFRDSGSHWSQTATENWMSFVETAHPRLREILDIDTSLGIVAGRQYEVLSGPIVYGSGTYSTGQKFYGSDADGTAYSGGTIKQIGAFIRSLPGHIGKPALIPLGLAYTGNGTVSSYYDTPRSIPVIVSCAPWMIDQGVYVAQEEFWMPDFLVAPQTTIQAKPGGVPAWILDTGYWSDSSYWIDTKHWKDS